MKQPKDFGGLYLFLKKYIPNLKRIKWENGWSGYDMFFELESVSMGLTKVYALFHTPKKDGSPSGLKNTVSLKNYPTIETFCKQYGGYALALPTAYTDYIIVPKHLPKDEIERTIEKMCF